MADELSQKLLSQFQFRPWPQGDPVAPWVLEHLDKVQLLALARVAVELNQAVLQAQMNAHAKALEIIGPAKR